MNRFIAMVAFVAGLVVAAPTYAWVVSEDVSIVEITAWEGASPIVFKLSNGTMCYILATEKNMYGLLLSMSMAGKRATVECHDTPATYLGYSAHYLRRITTTVQ